MVLQLCGAASGLSALGHLQKRGMLLMLRLCGDRCRKQRKGQRISRTASQTSRSGCEGMAKAITSGLARNGHQRKKLRVTSTCGQVRSAGVCVCVNACFQGFHSLLFTTVSIFMLLDTFQQDPTLPQQGTIHVLCAMVQRSGHSTCGYHG